VALALRPILISDEDDSFVSYIEASRMLTPFTTAIDRAMRKSSTWSTADQKLLNYLEKNRPALEKWREGSLRPDARYHQPGDTTVATFLAMASHLRTFSRLASLEGSRLEEQGAIEEACSSERASGSRSRRELSFACAVILLPGVREFGAGLAGVNAMDFGDRERALRQSDDCGQDPQTNW